MSKIQPRAAIQGFTLVELSIVIIIIGFLIAGIAAGTSLIKQAELNSVISDLRGYQTAYNNFLGRYGAVPGDFKSGAAVWTAAACDAQTTPALGTGESLCGGNGDGLVNTNHEARLAWKHLALAGAISAGISALPADATTLTASGLVVGTTIPGSKSNSGANGYYIIQGDNTVAGATFTTAKPSGLWSDGKTNAVLVGRPTAASLLLTTGGFKAEDAFNIDRKVDDGAISSANLFTGANTGIIRAFEGGTTTNACLLSTAADGSGGYAVSTGTALGCLVAQSLN